MKKFLIPIVGIVAVYFLFFTKKKRERRKNKRRTYNNQSGMTRFQLYRNARRTGKSRKSSYIQATAQRRYRD